MGAVERLLAVDTGRKPRPDAPQTVELLVAAARAALAEIGVDATIHEIARRAGVGAGAFRRLPSREALLEAVLTETIDELAGLARAVLTDQDAWAAFTRFAEEFVRHRAASAGVDQALGAVPHLDLAEPLAELRAQIRRMIEHVKTAGVLRQDVNWHDIPPLLAAAGTRRSTIGLQSDDEQWRRLLRIVLDGLRAEHQSAQN